MTTCIMPLLLRRLPHWLPSARDVTSLGAVPPLSQGWQTRTTESYCAPNDATANVVHLKPRVRSVEIRDLLVISEQMRMGPDPSLDGRFDPPAKWAICRGRLQVWACSTGVDSRITRCICPAIRKQVRPSSATRCERRLARALVRYCKQEWSSGRGHHPSSSDRADASPGSSRASSSAPPACYLLRLQQSDRAHRTVTHRTGRPGTLLCRAPLRTRACPFPSTRLKQAVEVERRETVRST